MPSFTKNEMRDELKTIFLYEADHILIGRGAKLAEAFIGFETNVGEYLNADIKQINLEEFSIARIFSQAYDYAFFPSILNGLDGSEIQDLNLFMSGTPRVGGVSSGGETHRFMTPDGLCQTVADAAFARWKLDEEIDDLTIRELALLADMTEGAVRNAVAQSDSSGLRPVKGSKPVRVACQDAVRWLQSRRGFIATPTRAKDDVFFRRQIDGAANISEMADAVLRYGRLALGDDFLRQVESKDQAEFLAALSSIDPKRAQRVAEILDLDVAHFAGRAIELALRAQLRETGE